MVHIEINDHDPAYIVGELGIACGDRNVVYEAKSPYSRSLCMVSGRSNDGQPILRVPGK